MFAPDGIGEVGPDDEAVEVGDHQEWRVLERFPIVEQLLVGPFEILVMPLVLPAKVPAKPDVRPAIATTRLACALLEGVRYVIILVAAYKVKLRVSFPLRTYVYNS